MEAGSGDEDDGDYAVHVQLRECGEHTVRRIKAPETVVSRRKWWVFVRQIEFILFETTKNKSNLLHDMEGLELSSTVRYYKRTGDHNTTAAQYKAIMGEFNEFRRSIDPLCGPAKHTSLIPLKVASTLALNRGHRALLECLGGQVPDAWLKEDEREQNEAEGQVDGRDLLPEEDSDEEDLGEDALYSLAMELADDFGGDAGIEASAVAEEEENMAKVKGTYCLAASNISSALNNQLKQYATWRTAVLCGSRKGKRVQDVTVATDHSCILRYLGWCRSQPGESGPLDFSTFAQSGARHKVEAYSRWCVEERELSMGSMGTYL
jgi:hypothetical protein